MFKLEITGKEYVVDVSRRSIKIAEKHGIDLSQLNGFGMTYDMFYIGLLKHQPQITVEEAYDLYDALLDEGDYDPSEVLELIGKGFEEVFSKLENPNPKKKILTQ